jgi:hypothetical protein
MWLDLDWLAYYLPHDEPRDGESVEIHPYRLSAQCQHERLSVPGDWLKRQVLDGVRKRIITNATRWEMGTRFRGD